MKISPRPLLIQSLISTYSIDHLPPTDPLPSYIDNYLVVHRRVLYPDTGEPVPGKFVHPTNGEIVPGFLTEAGTLVIKGRVFDTPYVFSKARKGEIFLREPGKSLIGVKGKVGRRKLINHVEYDGR